MEFTELTSLAAKARPKVYPSVPQLENGGKLSILKYRVKNNELNYYFQLKT